MSENPYSVPMPVRSLAAFLFQKPGFNAIGKKFYSWAASDCAEKIGRGPEIKNLYLRGRCLNQWVPAVSDIDFVVERRRKRSLSKECESILNWRKFYSRLKRTHWMLGEISFSDPRLLPLLKENGSAFLLLTQDRAIFQKGCWIRLNSEKYAVKDHGLLMYCLEQYIDAIRCFVQWGISNKRNVVYRERFTRRLTKILESCGQCEEYSEDPVELFAHCFLMLDTLAEKVLRMGAPVQRRFELDWDSAPPATWYSSLKDKYRFIGLEGSDTPFSFTFAGRPAVIEAKKVFSNLLDNAQRSFRISSRIPLVFSPALYRAFTYGWTRQSGQTWMRRVPESCRVDLKWSEEAHWHLHHRLLECIFWQMAVLPGELVYSSVEHNRIKLSELCWNISLLYSRVITERVECLRDRVKKDLPTVATVLENERTLDEKKIIYSSLRVTEEVLRVLEAKRLSAR